MTPDGVPINSAVAIQSKLARHAVERIVAFLLCVTGVSGAAESDDPQTVSFNRDIRPILSSNCWQCHGPDAAARQGGFRLDVRSEAERVLSPGQSDRSPLLERVRSVDPLDRMPPAETGKRLSSDEIELLRRWIDAGAAYEGHWSLIAPQRPAVPSPSNAKWVENDIDAFVLSGLDTKGLAPADRAEAEVLLRRVTLDLTGLPPTIEEIDAFLAHESAERAYEEAVARLLDSPRFGERMAVPWLDVARYADSYGYQSDLLSPTWPYRDWVVRAFNRNLPFDEFIRHQLAGDLVPNATREQRLATAFNRLHRMTNEGGSVEEEWRIEYVADRVQTFGTAFLGLTLHCARCHDHKFDPISTREYYELTAFFNSIDEWGMYLDSTRVPTPSLLLPDDEQEARLRLLESELQQAEAALEEATAFRDAAFREWLEKADDHPATIRGLTGHYPLDGVGSERQLENLADGANPGSTSGANDLIDGVNNAALRFTGDDPATFPRVVGGLNPWDSFSIAFWVRIPDGLSDCIIFHRSGGTDVGRFGTELSLKNGRLFFGMIRFWPGNAMAIEAEEPLMPGEWTHVTATYDGTGRAGGLRLYVNGRAGGRVVRDAMTKTPGAGGDGITFGERFRDRGLAGGAIDELHIFRRALSPIEAAHLHDGVSLRRALDSGREEALRAFYLSAMDDTVAAARVRRADAVRELFTYRTGITETMVMQETGSPRPAYVLPRGQYDAARTAQRRVDRGTPGSLPAMPLGVPRHRLGLADWLTDEAHPLTARVTVNRFWQQFFGRGLVSTSEDFGAQGAFPDMPDLLDWLAIEFIESGWDVKHLCHLIVTSATYRQASACRDDLDARDPTNITLARGPSGRLPAEMLRDLALAVAGLLDETMGGPPVSPYQPPGLWREANSMSPAYRQSVGTALYRRSLYTVWKRTAPMPNMMALDAATREVCVARRETTSSPVQALVLMNDPQFVEAARVAGERMLREGGATDSDRITYLFRLYTGRRPLAEELGLLLGFLGDRRAFFRDNPAEAARLLSIGERVPDPALDVVEAAAATMVSQTVLNMDATVWKR